MPGPRRLVDWPWVVLRVECEPCRYSAGYRIVRLAEKYGGEAELAALLERVRAKCRLIDRGRSRRQPAWSCSIRYRVPEGGPLPDGVPAREAKAGETWPPRPKRELVGPLPTIADVRAKGPPGVLVYCAGRTAGGWDCHHVGRVMLADIKLPLDLPYAHIPSRRVLRCSRCGSRKVSIMPDWPDQREAHARRMLEGETPPLVPGALTAPA